jgi:hypothetical protein
MNINSRPFVVAIPLLAAMFCAAYAGFTSWKQTHFACDSQMSIVDSRGQDDLIMHFRFDGKTGHVNTRGKYTPHNEAPIETSNKVYFTFWREGDSLVMISDDTNRLPKTPQPTLALSPDFFTARERGLRLQITAKNDSGYLFLYDGTPTLYCKTAP